MRPTLWANLAARHVTSKHCQGWASLSESDRLGRWGNGLEEFARLNPCPDDVETIGAWFDRNGLQYGAKVIRLGEADCKRGETAAKTGCTPASKEGTAPTGAAGQTEQPKPAAPDAGQAPKLDPANAAPHVTEAQHREAYGSGFFAGRRFNAAKRAVEHWAEVGFVSVRSLDAGEPSPGGRGYSMTARGAHKRLTELLEAAPKSSGQVARGLLIDSGQIQDFEGQLSGGSMDFGSMSSWTSDEGVAEGFASGSAHAAGTGGGPSDSLEVMMIMQTDRAVSIQELSTRAEEGEFIVGKGSASVYSVTETVGPSGRRRLVVTLTDSGGG